jgi:hypothetical protein
MLEGTTSEPSTTITQSQSAGTLRVVSSERSMKTYIITDSEIRNVGLANGIAGISFSFMAGLWGYAFSLSTDLMFADHPSQSALAWTNAMRPTCEWAGAAFLIFGVLMIAWRHRMINLIKRENDPGARPVQNRFVRAWNCIWFNR